MLLVNALNGRAYIIALRLSGRSASLAIQASVCLENALVTENSVIALVTRGAFNGATYIVEQTVLWPDEKTRLMKIAILVNKRSKCVNKKYRGGFLYSINS